MGELGIETPGVFDDFQIRLRQLYELNRIMAHNLRGAASNIRMLIDALDDNKQAHESLDCDLCLTDDEIHDCIRQSSNSMIVTLERLMEMNKRALDEEVKFELCDIRETVEGICQQLRAMLIKKHADVRMHLAENKLNYPRVYLENIIYNIVSNAIQYSKPDMPLQIDIVSKKRNGRQLIEIQDNGIGMDMPTYGNQLFRPYVSASKRAENHGLGLYLVKSQVESLGGKITVRSKLNAGTKFTVQL